MAEYIKRDELRKALSRLKVETGSLACLGCGYEHNCSTKGCRILRSAEKKIADMSPVRHGRWLPCEGHWDNAACSACGEVYTVTEGEENKELFKVFGELYNYCPNCGAKMDGGEDDGTD